MAPEELPDVQAARSAGIDAIPKLLESNNPEILRALIDNPALDETHVCLLLERKELSGTLLEEIGKRKTWRASYRVRLGLAAHPHTPRLIALRLLRELHLMDLVRISLLPASSMELRRLADERILSQLPQLPLGQRLMLARRGSGRVAAGLVAHGPEQAARAALDNPFVTEAQLLRTLANETLPPRIMEAVASHEKWQRLVNIRVALLRHPRTPSKCVPALVSGLPRREMRDLADLKRLPEIVRTQLREELASRENRAGANLERA